MLKKTRRHVTFQREKHSVDININISVLGNEVVFASKREQGKVKIMTKLSVAQLAYFFRVLYKMNKIKSSSQSDIMRFISETFETGEVSDISSKSLRSKYYSIEPQDKTIIRNQLLEIIKFIEQDQPL